MSDAAETAEAVANGWLDADDLAALERVPIDVRFLSEAERQRFYGLELEEKCAMIREMIWDRKGRYE